MNTCKYAIGAIVLAIALLVGGCATPASAPTPSKAEASTAAPTTAAASTTAPTPEPSDEEFVFSGYYENAEGYVLISNVNLGTDAISFTMETNDGAMLEGATEPEGSLAYYMDLCFELNADGSLTVTQYEKQTDSAEREMFVGNYLRYATSQSTLPFTDGDVQDLLGSMTITEAIDWLSPTSVSWSFMGEATGETEITLNCDGGSVSLLVNAPEGSALSGDGEDGENEPLSAIPPELMQEEVYVVGASWDDPEFTLFPIRGVQIGAPEEEVLRAFLVDREGDSGDLIYGIEALNPDADDSWATEWIGGHWFAEEGDEYAHGIEYVWTNLESPDDWHVYYFLRYYTEDNVVTKISLYWSTDPE